MVTKIKVEILPSNHFSSFLLTFYTLFWENTLLNQKAMGFQKKDKERKKKKGPKGKLARAKAKLDRQWGEHVDEEIIQQNKIRTGKSRLTKVSNSEPFANSQIEQDEHHLEDDSLNNTKQKINEHHVTSSSSDDDSEDNEEYQTKMISNVGAFDNLLSRIHSVNRINEKERRKRKYAANEPVLSKENKRDPHVINDDDESIEESDDDEESVDPDLADDEEENSDLDELVPSNEKTISKPNPFTNHFSTPPFASEEAASTSILESRSSTKLIPTPYLHPSLEIHLSGKIRDCMLSTENLTETKQYQEEMNKYTLMNSYDNFCTHMKKTWRSANSNVARRNPDSSKRMKLKSKNAFSTLQASIFPILSSYADMLCMAETREVRQFFASLE